MNKRQLARLKRVRDVMKDVPPEKVDMYRICGTECGCALFHLGDNAARLATADYFGIDQHTADHLFALTYSGYGRGTTSSRGGPAKREFLKRINAVIRKAEASK